MTLTSAAYIDRALARGTVYQRPAQACYYPTTDVFVECLIQELWHASLEEAGNALEDSAVILERLASLELAIPTCELSGLSAEYTRLFSNTAPMDFPPYGANYLASHIFMKAQSLADVTGFYHALGVDLEAGTERPNHVSVELKFMGYLCLKEAYAADHDLAEALEIPRRYNDVSSPSTSGAGLPSSCGALKPSAASHFIERWPSSLRLSWQLNRRAWEFPPTRSQSCQLTFVHRATSPAGSTVTSARWKRRLQHRGMRQDDLVRPSGTCRACLG